MGSWSVYCGISKIAITAGDKCVLLPLKKNKYQNWQYFTHQPVTLPIFGEYNDYGGLENIEENENTKLISEYFGVPIDEFAAWFTEETTYQRGDVDSANIKNFEEIKDCGFMWINREVYDFMSSNVSEKGHLEFGNPKILELIGFTRDGKSSVERYTEKWVYGDKELYADGHWVQLKNRKSIYYFDRKGDEKSYCLTGFIDVPEDKMWIGEKSMVQLWEYLDDVKIKKMFLPVLTGSYYDGHEELMESISKFLTEDQLKDFRDERPQTIINVYRNRIREFGKEFAELVTLASNFHPMSSTFEPSILYLTPQCGEHQAHQVLLDKFAEINRAKIQSREDEDY